MIVCPKCGYKDADCWHYPTYHGLEMPYARIDELELADSSLAGRIRSSQPLRKGVLEFIEEPFAYKYNIKSGFVRRRDFQLWKAFQWAQIPMEKPQKGRQLKLKEKWALEVFNPNLFGVNGK